MVACSFFSFSARSSFLFHFLQEYVPSSHNFFCLSLNSLFPSIYSKDKFHHHSSSYFVLPVQLLQRLVGKSEKGVLLQCLPQIKQTNKQTKKTPIEFNKYCYRNRRIRPVEQKGKFKDRCARIYMGT